MAALRGCDSPFDIARHGAALRRRGVDFVMRRYSRDPACNLGAREARALCGAGLCIGALWDGGAGLDRLPRRQGLLDGAQAQRLARAAGQPPGTAIYFGMSEQAARADLDGVVRNYLIGGGWRWAAPSATASACARARPGAAGWSTADWRA